MNSRNIHPARRRIWSGGLLLTIVLLLLGVNSGMAEAVTGYTVSAGTWNVRSCPGTCSPIESVTAGSVPDLVCQQAGPVATVTGFGTSGIWDLIRTPRGNLGYISDLAIAQTRYAQFTPGLPNCEAATTYNQSVVPAANGTGYGWIGTCTFDVLVLKKVWSCWVKAGKWLLTPGNAS